MHYPIKCPRCEQEFDSQDSNADSMEMLRRHLKKEHEED